MPFRFRSKDLRITQSKAGKTTYYVVEDPAREVRHRLYEMEYAVAQLLDGKRDATKIARQVNKKMGLSMQAVDVESFLQQLIALGFVEEL